MVSDQKKWDGSKKGLRTIGKERSAGTYEVGKYLSLDDINDNIALPSTFAFSIRDFKGGTKMEMPLYLSGKGLLNGLPKLLQNVEGAIEGVENLSAMILSMKGERNQAGSAGGTNNPFKKLKPDPSKPGNVLERDSNGTTRSKVAPEGFKEWWNVKHPDKKI